MTGINLHHLETAKLYQNSVKPGRVCIPGMTKGKKSTAQGGPWGWGTPSDSRTSRAGWPQTDRGNVCLVLAVPPLCPPVVPVPQRISGSTHTPLPMPWHVSAAGNAGMGSCSFWGNFRGLESISLWRAGYISLLTSAKPSSYCCGLLLQALYIFSVNNEGMVIFQLSFIHFCKALWFLSSIAVEKGSLERLKIAI